MATTISLDLLDLFVAVAETGSFSAAAIRLGVTKGTVSRGIVRLEELLGSELIHRTTRKVALSTAGQALLERASPHIASLRAAVCTLPELEEQPSGELKITAPTDFGIEILPDLVAGFALRFPAIHIDAYITNRTVDLGGEGFDLAIRAVAKYPLRDSAMAAKPLASVEMGYYASPSYIARRGNPRTVADEDHDWVMMRFARRTAAMPRGTHARVVGDDFFFIREVIRAGVGVGMLPSFLAEPAVLRGDMVRVLPAFRQRSQGKLVVLYPSARRVPRKVTAFRDYLIQTLESRPLFA
jgi:DNA-binding transcriptional LysR family regulator